MRYYHDICGETEIGERTCGNESAGTGGTCRNPLPFDPELGVRRTSPAQSGRGVPVADILGVSSESLLNDSETYIIKAEEQGGSKTARELEELVSEVIGLFAGGDLDEDEKDGIMEALNEAYWVAKRKNSRFTPNKYKKSTDDQ